MFEDGATNAVAAAAAAASDGAEVAGEGQSEHTLPPPTPTPLLPVTLLAFVLLYLRYPKNYKLQINSQSSYQTWIITN